MYYVSRGYRKISNNKCEGGVSTKYEPREVACPNSSKGQTKLSINNDEGLFGRSEAEILEEVRKEYGVNNKEGEKKTQNRDILNEDEKNTSTIKSSDGLSLFSMICIICLAFGLYTSRDAITEKVDQLREMILRKP